MYGSELDAQRWLSVQANAAYTLYSLIHHVWQQRRHSFGFSLLWTRRDCYPEVVEHNDDSEQEESTQIVWQPETPQIMNDQALSPEDFENVSEEEPEGKFAFFSFTYLWLTWLERVTAK